MATYKINDVTLMSHVCSTKELFSYDKKVKEWVLDEDKYKLQLETLRSKGWETYIHSKKMNKESVIRYFNGIVNTIDPITELIVEKGEVYA